ncbi:hypothetical protein GCM10027562_30240 [Arthrobacter pigmenti]
MRLTKGSHRVGRPDVALGLSAKITVEIANDGGTNCRSVTLAALLNTLSPRVWFCKGHCDLKSF